MVFCHVFFRMKELVKKFLLRRIFFSSKFLKENSARTPDKVKILATIQRNSFFFFSQYQYVIIPNSNCTTKAVPLSGKYIFKK